MSAAKQKDYAGAVKAMKYSLECWTISYKDEIYVSDDDLDNLDLILELVDRQREALRPFAKTADIKLCGDWRDDESIQGTDLAYHVKFGLLREARAVLALTDGEK